ncbi:hypothetical protein B0H63DRAFT_159653 [Podospora didyma]|uniref:Uncharacterized protein n=1 Tax=Podospora didyma TaxID=330526 RepID=A0AAE0U1H3_9PEZI|nr:hypothetical protein B0H63DRAFT_159653 [Podospora didyma]
MGRRRVVGWAARRPCLSCCPSSAWMTKIWTSDDRDRGRRLPFGAGSASVFGRRRRQMVCLCCRAHRYHGRGRGLCSDPDPCLDLGCLGLCRDLLDQSRDCCRAVVSGRGIRAGGRRGRLLVCRDRRRPLRHCCCASLSIGNRRCRRLSAGAVAIVSAIALLGASLPYWCDWEFLGDRERDAVAG